MLRGRIENLEQNALSAYPPLFSVASITALLKYPEAIFVVTVEAFMQTRLIQEYKDKTITHIVHEVLT